MKKYASHTQKAHARWWEKYRLFICEMTFTRNDIQREFIGWVRNEIISHSTMIIKYSFNKPKEHKKLNVISKKKRILIAICERSRHSHSRNIARDVKETYRNILHQKETNSRLNFFCIFEFKNRRGKKNLNGEFFSCGPLASASACLFSSLSLLFPSLHRRKYTFMRRQYGWNS